jgi:predicted hotdog family 3-hydroxylacyl-ACP dehydratase
VTLDQAAIRNLVPHAGAMCLLYEVLQADADSIRARAVSHRDPANPLREHGVLPALCGVEYAAQAMAVHGALHDGQRAGGPRPGMLAAVRDVELKVERLDDIAEDLVIEAHCLLNESGRLLYRFEVRANNRELLQGRATVVTE